ncbi:MAG: hypothetical protein HYR84_08105, partial [Planctomycetes bacterium]|nr:hypothetical protein [Planctomycetota bacterium]
MRALERHLATKHADRDADRDMTDLVTKIAKLKYAPGKRAIYGTVFYWFGFDDTMTAHPRLFVLKNMLEKRLNSRALVACADLRDVQVRSIVFLTNRKALAAHPRAEPEYTALLHVLTNTRFDVEGSDERKRREIATKLKLPADCVGLTWRIAVNGTVVCHVDARLDTQPGYFLMWQVCEFLRHKRDANDDRFLRWAVENRRLSRGLASELIPQLFPPEKRPDPAIHYRDAEYLAVKLFSHYGLEKLKQFTYDKPGSFKALVESGVFSKEDAAKIALHKFDSFCFTKNAAFSRRYELSLHYMIEDDHHSTGTGFNHLG